MSHAGKVSEIENSDYAEEFEDMADIFLDRKRMIEDEDSGIGEIVSELKACRGSVPPLAAEILDAIAEGDDGTIMYTVGHILKRGGL